MLDKPNILFVAHSAGGIVVRHMLTRQTDAFADKTIGLLLIASPSVGSRDADRFDFVADMARAKQGQQLEFNNPFLESLDKDFKNLVYNRRIQRLVGSEWLEHYLVYNRYLGILRDSVVVDPESGGRYFGEPVRLAGSDHISIVKPSGRQHQSHRMLSFFYETVFEDAILGDQEFAVKKTIRGPKASSSNASEAPLLRINERHSAEICSGQAVLGLTSVWKQENGRPRPVITLRSSAFQPEKATLAIGDTIRIAADCSVKLIRTGRDDKYYALFQRSRLSL